MLKLFSSSTYLIIGGKMQKELDDLAQASTAMQPLFTKSEQACPRHQRASRVLVGVWASYISYKLALRTLDMKAIEAFRALDKGCWGFIRKDDFVDTIKTVLPTIDPQVALDAFAGLAGEKANLIGYQRWLEVLCQNSCS
jgi:hypothetical protein